MLITSSQLALTKADFKDSLPEENTEIQECRSCRTQ
jgi:hypothetical protein